MSCNAGVASVQVSPGLYINWERTSARDALWEALRLGDILAVRPENKDNRGIARDCILAHYHLSALATQIENPSDAHEHLKAARALLDGMAQDGPFSR